MRSSGKLFDYHNEHKGLIALYDIHMPDGSAAQGLYKSLVADEESFVRLMSHNSRLKNTNNYYPNDVDVLGDDSPQPGVAGFEHAARMEIGRILSPAQSRKALDSLYQSLDTMQKFDKRCDLHRDFFRKAVSGDIDKSMNFFAAMLDYDEYKANKKFRKCLHALITCDADSALKLFLPKLLRLISPNELRSLQSTFINPVIESGKFDVLDAMLVSGFCHADDMPGILLTVLMNIAIVSWRTNWMLSELNSSDLHANKDEMRSHLLSQWLYQVVAANEMLHTLLTTHGANADTALPSLIQGFEESELYRVIYLNHQPATIRELAAAYRANLPGKDNLPDDIMAWLKIGLDKVINAPCVSEATVTVSRAPGM